MSSLSKKSKENYLNKLLILPLLFITFFVFTPKVKALSNVESAVKIKTEIKSFTPVKDTLPDKVFSRVEQPATFPGGSGAWLKYITPIIQKNGNKLIENKNNSGTCVVRFIVNKDGSVSDVQATTMKGTALAGIAVNAIKQGPKWIPGNQNDRTVNFYVLQPVTFQLNDNLMIKNEPE